MTDTTATLVGGTYWIYLTGYPPDLDEVMPTMYDALRPAGRDERGRRWNTTLGDGRVAFWRRAGFVEWSFDGLAEAEHCPTCGTVVGNGVPE